ncbi:MAG: NAD(P)/FAD-dependent oxidoreductase [Bacteroidota bacterium]
MKKSLKTDVLIIGGGLSGLCLQYFLEKNHLTSRILEARDRLGGRILTAEQAGSPPIEMGATWLGKKHQQLNALLEELGLEIFSQRLGNTAIYEAISTSPHQLVNLPPNEDPSFRIKGGSSRLIKTLAAKIDAEHIYLGQKALSIEEDDGKLIVESEDIIWEAKFVVSTLPPYLFKQSISLSPALPDEVLGLMENTHTWMGESIKFGLSFDQPFWREESLSGTLVSNVGPIPEMYDHANFEDDAFALKGFFNSAYFPLKKEERLGMILNQLRKYYGEKVDNYTSYQEKVWANEPFTYASYKAHLLPHQNNGHELYRKPYLNGKLFISGSETAAMYPGYMDGAVSAANFVFSQLSKLL